MMVLRRCAMVMMVEPLKFCRMALWMKASVSPSTLAVASSSTSTLGLHAAPHSEQSWHQEHAGQYKDMTRISWMRALGLPSSPSITLAPACGPPDNCPNIPYTLKR